MRLPKTYDPSAYEADIYSLWDKAGVFEPGKHLSTEQKARGEQGYFSLTLPPPNANGNLHIGHALTIAIEDALVRYHRLKGKKVLYIPGADHAGFESWVVYEKKLNAEGKSRFDFTREELYQQVWDFVEQNSHNMQTQVRAMGAGVDWTRFTYTLDDKVVAQTYDTFKKMWDEGLIYRGKRIVNYCTKHGTSFADIEVVHEQEDTQLWHIAYPLADGEGEVVIATTRPETKLGQAALMVHPKDERYKHLIGKQVNQPLVPNSPIPIIADEYVEMEFGTGVVTVTPGHDPNDFEVARRHNLPAIELITTEGRMSENVPEHFRGMPVSMARQSVADAMEKGGFIRKVDDYTHSIGKCYKCGTPIEPLLREQWFVKMRPLADKAIEVLNSDKIAFYPRSKKEQTIRYLKEVKDWNISRQIAWGIPIPAYANVADRKDWIFDNRVDREKIDVDSKTYQRDPDVFDTWFSSGHWPLVTLGYPDNDDFKNFYPLSLMETGGEILYQWVARMIMLGIYNTGEAPFRDVYIHGYVLAEDGAKMSKSLGNVIDPLELIGQYGSDALRAGLLTGRRPAVNQGYHPAKIVAARNFANKLWNVARYVEAQVGEGENGKIQAQPASPADHWILERLNTCITEADKAMSAYRISEAYELVYHFIWHDFADWYVEASKLDPNPGMLGYVLQESLKIAHPFMPFVTEAIWQTLHPTDESFLAVQSWPQASPFDAKLSGQFELAKTIITEVRQLSTALGVSKQQLLVGNSADINSQSELISRLGRLGGIKEVVGTSISGLRLTHSPIPAWLDVDPALARKYLDKLKTQHQAQQQTVDRLKTRLDNPEYTQKAPQVVVAQSRAQLQEENAKLERLSAELSHFEGSIS